MEHRTFLPMIALAALLGWSHPSYAQTVKAGVTGAARRETTGMLRGQPPTALRVGADVFIGERITTDADGRSQLLFPRGARLFIEPNSSVVLLGGSNDSSAATGRIELSILQGQIQLSAPQTPGIGSEARAEQVKISIGQNITSAGLGGGPNAGNPPSAQSNNAPSPQSSNIPRSQSNNAVGPLLGKQQQVLTADLQGSGILHATLSGSSIELQSLGANTVYVADQTGNRVAVRPGFSVTYSPATGLSEPQRIRLDSVRASAPRAGASGAAQSADLPPLGATDAGPRSLSSLDPRWLDVVGGFGTGQLGNVREQTAVTNEVQSRLTMMFQQFLPATVTVTDANGTRTASVSVGAGGRLNVSPSGQSINAFLGQTRPLPVTVQNGSGTHMFTIPR